MSSAKTLTPEQAERAISRALHIPRGQLHPGGNPDQTWDLVVHVEGRRVPVSGWTKATLADEIAFLERLQKARTPLERHSILTGRSYRDLAALLDISQSAVNHIATGEYRASPEMRVKILKVLGIEMPAPGGAIRSSAFGQFLKAQGLTLAAAAEKSGLSRQTLANYSKGAAGAPEDKRAIIKETLGFDAWEAPANQKSYKTSNGNGKKSST